MRCYSAFTALLAVGAVSAVDEVVDLGYARYRGATKSPGVTSWTGMRFAAPPTGDLRFAAPQDPAQVQGVQDASKRGPACLATGKDLPADEAAEDCLFISVYAPSKATVQSKLPTFLYLSGGGFNALSDAKVDGTGLVNAGDQQLIFVTANYRVGPYGFLSGDEITKQASNNNGLKDQRKALHWIKKHIQQFGGDPDHVVLGGASAGAASVTLQLAAYNGSVDGLFHGTAASAQSFGRIATTAEAQYQYDNLVLRSGCANSVDTLACLRGLNTTFLQSVNINTPSGGAPDAPLYMYSPVLDNDFLTGYTLSQAFTNEAFPLLPAIYGDSTNEGTIFVPKGTDNASECLTFHKDQWPTFTLTQLRSLVTRYPPDEKQPQFPTSGKDWRRCSDVYGELRYICPGIYLSRRYADRGGATAKIWNYRWDVVDRLANASGVGVSHTVELNAIFGAENVGKDAPESYGPGGVNYDTARQIQRYWANFIRFLDPNGGAAPAVDRASAAAVAAREVAKAASLPAVRWETWQSGGDFGERRLLFRTEGVVMETVPLEQTERCHVLLSFMEPLRQ